jgi:hypothetical protein
MMREFAERMYERWRTRPMTARRQWCINQRAKLVRLRETPLGREARRLAYEARRAVALMLQLLADMVLMLWRVRVSKHRLAWTLRRIAGTLAACAGLLFVSGAQGVLHASTALIVMQGQGLLVPDEGGPGGDGFARKPSGGIYDTPTAPTPLRTFYVDFGGVDGSGGGNDANDGLTPETAFLTIGKINSTATAGDRFICWGTSSGTLALGTATNSGTSGNPIQIVRRDGFGCHLNNGGSLSEYPPITFSERAHWWFQGFDVTRPTGAARAIQVYNSQNFTFVDVSLLGEYCGNFYLINCPDFRWYGGVINGSFGGTYANGDSNDGDVIWVTSGSDRFFMARVEIDVRSYHGTIGIGRVADGETEVYDAHIFDIYLRNTAAGGIWAGYGTARNTLLEWSTFEDMGTAPDPDFYTASRESILVQSWDSIVRYNTVRNSGIRAIFVSSYYYGGYLQKSVNCHVHNNTVVDCLGVALYLYAYVGVLAQTELAGNVFENNVFAHNATSTDPADAVEGNGYFGTGWHPIIVNLYNCDFPWDNDSLAGNIFRNNLAMRTTADDGFLMIWKNPLSSPPGTQGSQFYTLAEFEALFPECVGNIANTDPLLVNYAAGDMRLQAGSPCIDAGYPTTDVTFLGTAPDLGVYEYSTEDVLFGETV